MLLPLTSYLLPLASIISLTHPTSNLFILLVNLCTIIWSSVPLPILLSLYYHLKVLYSLTDRRFNDGLPPAMRKLLDRCCSIAPLLRCSVAPQRRIEIFTHFIPFLDKDPIDSGREGKGRKNCYRNTKKHGGDKWEKRAASWLLSVGR